jgi:hypothetical protein
MAQHYIRSAFMSEYYGIYVDLFESPEAWLYCVIFLVYTTLPNQLLLNKLSKSAKHLNSTVTHCSSRVVFPLVLAHTPSLLEALPLRPLHQASHGEPLAASFLTSRPALLLVAGHPALLIAVLPSHRPHQDLLGELLLKRMPEHVTRYNIVLHVILLYSVLTTSYRVILCRAEVPVRLRKGINSLAYMYIV